MSLKQHIVASCLLLVMTILCLSAHGQEGATKSGTPIRPADRMPAISLGSAKSLPPTDATAGTYIIVTKPDLTAPLMPLIKWKRQQGYRVEVLVTDTYLRDSIRAQLLERYSQASIARPAQRHVLLVGDVDRIQAFAERHTPSGLTTRVTDMYYGEYTGDYIPEAYVGRLSVADSAELAAAVAKIVAYEQGQWADATHQVMLAAGNEARSPAPTTTNGQVNYLGELTAQGWPEMDTVCFRNPGTEARRDSLLQAIRQGNALVNYTAHCSTSGWENPNITFNTLDTLMGDVPTLFVNNCCRSNAFDGTCFGELLLRRPTGGAVGVIGATNETLWAEDFYWAVGAKCPPTLHPHVDSLRPGAFDNLLLPHSTPYVDANDYTLGAMLHAGCMAVSMAGSPYDAFYWETYCLLGDPAMIPFFDRGESLWASLPDSIEAGSSMMTVVCSPLSRISVTVDTALLATTMSDDEGNAQLLLSHALTGDSVTMTVTRPNAVPLIVSLPVVSPQAARLAVADYGLEDSLLGVKIKNVGGMAARGHGLELLQDSCDRRLGATFDTPTPEVVTLLPPQADTLITFNLGNQAIGIEPILSAKLVATDSLGQPYDTLSISFATADLRPKIEHVVITDSTGRPAGRLVPGGEYRLAATLSHAADSVVLAVGNGEAISGLWTPIQDNTQIATFTFRVAEEGGDHLQISTMTYKDKWHHCRDYCLPLYDTWERFETGDLGNMPWSTGTLYPWAIDSSTAHEGGCCIRSASIGDAQRSTLELIVETMADDSVSFYFKVSSEAHDWLYFFIDGRRVGYWSGNSGWRRYVRPLSAGRHILQWVYQKDASTSERDDCAYLDDLSLPLAVWERCYGTSEHGSTPTAINSITGEKKWTIYPNPSRGRVNITLEGSPQQRYIEIIDMCGRKVDKIFVPPCGYSTQYFTTLLRFGVYTFVLHDATGSHIQKLIVTE